MDTLTSKSRRRKAMRVATIFTGAATATIGMAQAAHAQDLRPANIHAVRPGHLRGMAPAGRIYGSIRSVQACAENSGGPIDPHYLHVSTTGLTVSGGWFITSLCFGFKGEIESPPFTGIRAECGGNNHGFVLGVAGGRTKSYNFGPGTGYHTLSWSHLYTVAINSWTGNDACPQAPHFGSASYPNFK